MSSAMCADLAAIHEQSHGESFLDAIGRHTGSEGLYLLDEPESALSVRGQLALLRYIHDGLNRGSHFISTHSPILLAFPEARILRMTDEGPVSTDYRETEQFQLTRDFLEDPGHSSAISLRRTRGSDLPSVPRFKAKFQCFRLFKSPAKRLPSSGHPERFPITHDQKCQAAVRVWASVENP